MATLNAKKELFDKNPFSELQSKSDKFRRNHPKGSKDDPKGWLEGNEVQKCANWLKDVKEKHPICFDVQNNKATKNGCDCLSCLEINKVAAYMVDFLHQSKQTRQTILKTIISMAKAAKPGKGQVRKNPRVFTLSLAGSETIRLCLHGFRNLFYLRQSAWNTLNASVAAGEHGGIRHGNTGNTNKSENSQKAKAKPYVLKYLDELAKIDGTPYATRFIRELNGMALRETEVDHLIELSSSNTKRRIYRKFCYEQGWVMPKGTAKGSYGRTKDYQKRMDDEWPEDEDPLPVCSYSCFIQLWKLHRPLIRIRPKSQDTCGECYTLRNYAKYGKRKRTDSDEESSDDDNFCSEEPDDDFEFQETIMEKAAIHAKAAKEMRRLIDDRIKEAHEDATNNVPHAERHYVRVMDYAQNLDIPHFGDEQPGETYYYSPLNVFVFGIADVTVQPTHLYAYCYDEGTGKKGANNVASLLMHHLKSQQILKEDENGNPIMGKCLTIAADNCTGQNKNNTVLALAAFLCEKGYFGEVEILFYVRGHTKNACDRLFNLLKIEFHNKDIFTFKFKEESDNLLNVLDCCEDVTVVEATKDMFRDWDNYTNKLYRPLNKVLINHVFRVTHGEQGKSKTTMITKEDDAIGTEAEHRQELAKRMTEARRLEILSQEPAELEPPGIREIKQVDLYRKWGKLVPEQFRDVTCPAVSREMIERVTKARKANKKNKSS